MLNSKEMTYAYKIVQSLETNRYSAACLYMLWKRMREM